MDCKDQIKMFDKNGIPYCENPKCNDRCPVGVSAECKKSNNTINVNDKNKNKCSCLPGFYGEYCEDKKYIDFR